MSEIDNKTNPSNEGANPANDKTDDKEAGKTFTNEELGQKLSAERKKLKEQFEKEKADAIADALKEAERKAKLTEDQKAAEAQKEAQEALDKREQEITLRERKAEAIETLTDKGISPKLVDFVVDVDADKTAKNIDTLTEVFNKAVEEGVKAKLAGSTPKDRGSTTVGNDKKSATTGVYTGNGRTAF